MHIFERIQEGIGKLYFNTMTKKNSRLPYLAQKIKACQIEKHKLIKKNIISSKVFNSCSCFPVVLFIVNKHVGIRSESKIFDTIKREGLELRRMENFRCQ